MKDFVLDLVEYSVRAALLLYLCKDIILLKEKYRSVGKVLFFLQAFLISFWLSYSQWINKLMSKDADMENNSSYSIISLILIFACSYAAMDILYQGKRLAKLYLLLVYYTVKELVRFGLHSIWSLTTTACYRYLGDQVVTEKINIDRYFILSERLQFWSLIVYGAATAGLMFLVFRLFKRYQTVPVTEMSREGIRFLMLMPVIGTIIDASWRILLFYQKGTVIESLYDRHASMYIVIPVISVLCLTGIVFSCKIYAELMRSEEQKNSLIFYKQQLTDMTEHVKELEQLYDGIRGMRHDINNYVADMEQLLQVESDKGQISRQVQSEARGYLRNMQSTVSALTLRFSTGNPVTDVILNRKGHICAQEGIAFDGEFLYPAGFMIEAFDLGIVLNNALDNAIEACRKLPDNSFREIRFRGYEKGRMFFLVIENTYDQTAVKRKDGKLLTTKEDEFLHGLGMSNIGNCVEKYYGTMQFETRQEKFVLTVMLQGRQADAVNMYL